MSRSYRRLPASIEADALTALLARGLTRSFVTLAYAKWKQHERADECRFGKERPIAVDCNCPGCHEVLCFVFFDQALKQFGMLTPP